MMVSMLITEPSTEEILTYERGIIRLRWLGIVSAAIALPFLGLSSEAMMYGVVGFAAAYNVLLQYYALPYHTDWTVKHPAVLTIGDIALTSAAVYATGGLHSEFFVIYFALTVLAAVRFGGRTTTIVTVISVATYALVVLLAGVPHLMPAFAALLIRAGFIAITGVLVGYYGDKTRQAERRMQAELARIDRKLGSASTALVGDVSVEGVIRTAAREALSLVDADYALLMPTPPPEDLGLAGTTDAMTAEMVASRPLGVWDSTHHKRLADQLNHVVPASSSDTLHTGSLAVRTELADLLQVPVGTVIHIIRARIWHGSQILGDLWLIYLPPYSAATAILNALEVFVTRLAISLINAMQFSQSKRQAITDPVTGLYNYRHLYEELGRTLLAARARRLPISLVIIDIDAFKKFNDTYGHLIGDSALKAVADSIRRVVGQDGICARFGGDEFAVVLTSFTNEEACALAERIRLKTLDEATVALFEPLSTLTISVGVATSPDGLSDPEGLFQQADGALNLAKRGGKNQVVSAHEVRALADAPSRAIPMVAAVDRPGDDETAAQVVEMLLNVMDAKAAGLRGHGQRVAALALRMAEQLGMRPSDVEVVRIGALIHDVGYTGIPEPLLAKPDAWTDDDWLIAKTHPFIGTRVLEPLKAFALAMPMVLYHHEWYDGTGYPFRLAGDAIPLSARIVALADVYDNLTRPRGPGRVYAADDALAAVKDLMGRQFDPQLWEPLCTAVQETVVM